MPKDNFPAPDKYLPEMSKTDKGFYRFPQAERFGDEKRQFIQPGPGHYETLNLPTGLKKTMLGGSIIKKEDPGNGVPGPATYFTADSAEADPRRFAHVPGFKIMKPSHVPDEPKGKQNEVPVGPWKYSPKHPTHVSSAWKIGTWQRGEIKTKSN